MTDIERTHRINVDTLRTDAYFLSLLEQSAKFLPSSTIDKIQIECLTILAKKTEQYNGGDSSSIRMEVAQELFASIVFTVGVALKAYPYPDDALDALLQMGVDALYKKGQADVCTLLRETKLFAASVIWQCGIGHEMLEVFAQYNVEFAAHIAPELPHLPQYPAFVPSVPLLGIEYIEQFIQWLHQEVAQQRSTS